MAAGNTLQEPRTGEARRGEAWCIAGRESRHDEAADDAGGVVPKMNFVSKRQRWRLREKETCKHIS